MPSSEPPTEIPPALLLPPPRDPGELRHLRARTTAFYQSFLRMFVAIVGGLLMLTFGLVAILRTQRAGWYEGLKVLGWGTFAVSLTLILIGIPIWLFIRANTKRVGPLLTRGAACSATITGVERGTGLWVSVAYVDPRGVRRTARTNVRAWDSEKGVAAAAVVLVDADNPSQVGVVIPGLSRGAYGCFVV